MRLFYFLVLSLLCAASGWAQYSSFGGVGTPGTNGTNGTNGATGPAGPITNQIMDWKGVKYTITNEPAANHVIKFNPANTTAYFAAEAAGNLGDWSGTMATQMVFWSVTNISTNFDAVTATNLIVSGNIDPNITGTYANVDTFFTPYPMWGKDGASDWIVYATTGDWYLGDSAFLIKWKGPWWGVPESPAPEGAYIPLDDQVCTGTATIALSYVGAVITTNVVTWQAGYNPSSQAFQIIRDGVVLESWSAPKEPTYPVFRLPMGSAWTDFELKASTNNFTNLVYYYISSGTNTVGYGDSNAWVYFSDDYQTDVRAWRQSPVGSNIYAQLTSTNAAIDTIYVMPSHDCEIPWATWMSPTNKNLIWSWVRFDGVDFEKNFDGSKQRWNLIRPEWELERTTP